MRRIPVVAVLVALSVVGVAAAVAEQAGGLAIQDKEISAERNPPATRPAGRVHVVGRSLVDANGPFLGLGVSYFTALWRCKYDRARLESDLAFLSGQGFNYYRMLSMVGWYPAWDGLEIAPVGYTSREGKAVEAWPDYWQQLAELVDLAFDRYGMRTQITIFADAQLMPEKQARLAHMDRLLSEVVAGREHKIILLEVANEAWQNGFPGEEGVAALHEFTRFLNERTAVPVAITSNHHDSFTELYTDSAADIATWHFSRDRGPDDGWMPVYDCWDYGDLPGVPPASSNEPIGPGSSVAAETDPVRLVMAAAFAYSAGLPMYVFHSEAGVFGRARFEDMPGIDRVGQLLRLLPPDLPSWERNDGKEPRAPFTVFAGGRPNAYIADAPDSPDGCVRNTGTRKGDRFICLPIGIQPGGLELQARGNVRFRVIDPLTAQEVLSAKKRAGERFSIPPSSGACIILGKVEK
jgi:hypothetical protein